MTLEELQKQVDELKAWKEQKTRQQFTFPIDTESQNTFQKDMLVFTGQEVTPVGLLADLTALEVKVNDNTFWLLASLIP